MNYIEYQEKDLELIRKYLPYHKWYTIIAVILFILFLPSLFGYFIKLGLLSAIGLLIMVCLSGYTVMIEADKRSDMLH